MKKCKKPKVNEKYLDSINKRILCFKAEKFLKGETTDMFTKIEKDLKEALNSMYGTKPPAPAQCAILMNTGMSLLADVKSITQETSPWVTGWELHLNGTHAVRVDDQLLMEIVDSWKAALRPELQYEKVIFNGPATIVFWKDGTKTVVKCRNGETFDREKGLAMCFMKKVVGDSFHNVLAKEVYNTEKKYVRCYISMGIKDGRTCKGKQHKDKRGIVIRNKKCEQCPYLVDAK